MGSTQGALATGDGSPKAVAWRQGVASPIPLPPSFDLVEADTRAANQR